MATRIQQRRGTTAEWEAANPVLAEGELGIDLDTHVVKFGDGVSLWSNLPGINANASSQWDADTMAIARGFYEVVSATEPAITSYTASNNITYPVVWQTPIELVVPVLPSEPTWSRSNSTVTVPALVGIQYRVVSITEDGVTTAVNYVLTPSVQFNVTTITEATSLPYRVTVQAFAVAGYSLPAGSYSWFYDFPDPNATMVLTSDTFTVDRASALNTPSNAALGGTAYTYLTPTNAVVSAGKLDSGDLAFFNSGTRSYEIELDAVEIRDGVSNPTFYVFLCSTNNIGSPSGFRVQPSRADTGLSRVYDGKTSQSDVELRYGTIGTTIYGHWKFSVVGDIGTIVSPGATPLQYTLTQATIANFQTIKRDSYCFIRATNMRIDNLVIKQVGF